MVIFIISEATVSDINVDYSQSFFLVFQSNASPIPSRVSNKMGQCNFSGLRDKCFFIVPGQRDNGTSSKSCQRMGRARIACQNPGRDIWQPCSDFVLVFLLLLSGDKGTARQGNFFVQGQKDIKMSRPGLSRDVPLNVLSLGNPNY